MRNVNSCPCGKGCGNAAIFNVTGLSSGGLRTILVNATQITLACYVRRHLSVLCRVTQLVED